MELTELISVVEEIVQDPAFSHAAITTTLNRGLLTIAKGVMLPGRYQLSPPLPDLYTTGSVQTVVDSGVCSLPDDFSREVVQVLNSDEEIINLAASFKSFLTSNPQKDTGSVRVCVVNGKKLLYRDLPSEAETLEVHYYATPAILEDNDSEPDCVPEHLHHDLLVGFAAKTIWGLKEDGIDGQKINTQYWTNVFQAAILDLVLFLGEDGEAAHYNDEGGYID